MAKANPSDSTEGKAGKNAKPKKKKTILIILIILVVTAAGAYAYFHKSADQTGEVKKAKTVKTTEQEVLDMGEIVVNLGSNGGSHYLRVKIVIEYPKDKKLAEELKKKKHIISDTVITTLRSKTYAEVISANSAQGLKNDLIREINNNLVSGDITGMYFTDFLVQ